MPLIRTTFEPWREIFVTEAVYLALLRQGLIFTGTTPPPPPAFNDAQYAELASATGEAAQRIIQAVGESELVNGITTSVLADVDGRGYVNAGYVTDALDAYVPDPNDIAQLIITSAYVQQQIVTASLNTFVRKGGILFSVEDYGASGTGTDDTSAFIAASAAMKNIPNGGRGKLYVPPGQSNIDPAANSQIFPAGKTIALQGAGMNISEIRPINGATGDLIDMRGGFSSISDLTLDGRMSVVSGITSLLSVSAYRFGMRGVQLRNSSGDAIAVGKYATAIASQFSDFIVRAARGYGARVYQEYDSTDIQWISGDIGTTGKSCFRSDSAAQNFGPLHVWTGGMLDPTDNYGFWLRGRRNVFNGTQSERNLGDGFFFDSSLDAQHNIGSILAYNNGNAGVRINGTDHQLSIRAERNGILNPGSNATTYAGVVLSSATDCDIDISAWDAATSVPGYDIPANLVPTGGTGYPFPGRSGSVLTQSYGIVETGASNRNSIRGMARGERHRSNLSAILIGGQTDARGLFQGQNANAAVPSVAAASPFTIPPSAETVEVTGSTVINNIVSGRVGRVVTLCFVGATPGGISAGATNVTLRGGAFTPTTFGSITLRCGNGSSWYEVSRA